MAVKLLLSVTALAISRRARTFCAAERALENLHAQSPMRHPLRAKLQVCFDRAPLWSSRLAAAGLEALRYSRSNPLPCRTVGGTRFSSPEIIVKQALSDFPRLLRRVTAENGSFFLCTLEQGKSFVVAAPIEVVR